VAITGAGKVFTWQPKTIEKTSAALAQSATKLITRGWIGRSAGVPPMAQGARRMRISSETLLPLQSQLFPQLHSLLSFIGQFLPVFLQVGLSAAKVVVQITAARIENRILV
jgi:hypothetical protein